MKRRATRYMAGIPATVHSPIGDVPCRAFDLSRSGALLEGDLDYRQGERFPLTLRSVAGDLSVRVMATSERAAAGH